MREYRDMIPRRNGDHGVPVTNSSQSESHTAPGFIKTFGETLSLTRKLFQSTNPAAQPFIIAGSGTLGWDLVSSNLIEKGENALVLHTGYFADSFADCLETYGANATQIKAPIGDRPSFEQIEQALKESARPGHSEHQLGTALDFRSAAGPPAWELDDWAQTPAGAWMAEHAPRFGFVMSYPRGEEETVCYAYESWHYRYVGRDVARTVRESGLTLREWLWQQQ